LGPIANTFFAIATLGIAIPTGIKVFNWLFKMRGGVIRFTIPTLFAIGFVLSFDITDVTVVMICISSADYEFHNTNFVSAHFHYVIISSTIFSIFAGLYYW